MPTKFFDKLLWGLIPACVTFGPLFMTRIAGSAAPENGNRLVTMGTFMLSIGLAGMFRIIAKQQRDIREFEAHLGNNSQPEC